MRKTLLALTLSTVAASAAFAQDWSAVEAAIGRPGVAQAGGVYRFNFPRSDMEVWTRGVRVKTAFALGGWIAMKPVSDGVMAMGDLVLADDEVEAVMLRLQQGGVEQTAVHHHLLHESPRVLYMHVHAHGDPAKIGAAVRAALALTRTPAPPAPAASPASAMPAIDLDTAAVAAALGRAGRVNGGVYQVTVPRADTVREGSFVVPPSMGLATAINFQPTGNGRAAITGDFVLLAAEVNPVLRALRDNGIEATSLHNHLIDEEPRLFFMHFWANDDAVKLARGLKAALDLTHASAR
ncbi:MAG TPA: DUF1259 domain-containing protein [Gemmatimonadaceae bacterium]|nr:DUF1259 domain-containing protein [Gemmatimonadaceae bacterium]